MGIGSDGVGISHVGKSHGQEDLARRQANTNLTNVERCRAGVKSSASLLEDWISGEQQGMQFESGQELKNLFVLESCLEME